MSIALTKHNVETELGISDKSYHDKEGDLLVNGMVQGKAELPSPQHNSLNLDESTLKTGTDPDYARAQPQACYQEHQH